MRLYYFPVAPNPARVRLYLAEKAAAGAAIPVEPVLVNLVRGEQREPAHLARNPFGTLPVLELDDGGFLVESTAIVEYLEERWPEPPMLGGSPEQRARARDLERIADTRVLMPMGRLVHATRSPLGRPPRPEVAEDAAAALEVGLAFFDRLLGDGRRFIGGDRPAMADCTLAAALQFGRFRDLHPAGELGRVSAWEERMRSREAVRSVLDL